eukprot:403365134
MPVSLRVSQTKLNEIEYKYSNSNKKLRLREGSPRKIVSLQQTKSPIRSIQDREIRGKYAKIQDASSISPFQAIPLGYESQTSFRDRQNRQLSYSSKHVLQNVDFSKKHKIIRNRSLDKVELSEDEEYANQLITLDLIGQTGNFIPSLVSPWIQHDSRVTSFKKMTNIFSQKKRSQQGNESKTTSRDRNQLQPISSNYNNFSSQIKDRSRSKWHANLRINEDTEDNKINETFDNYVILSPKQRNQLDSFETQLQTFSK